MEYDVNYFIEKFEKIPEKLWRTDGYGYPGEPRCALGHCGENNMETSAEACVLNKLFSGIRLARRLDYDSKFGVPEINDGENKKYKQPTPKQRILAALYDIREETIKAVNVDKPAHALADN